MAGGGGVNESTICCSTGPYLAASGAVHDALSVYSLV